MLLQSLSSGLIALQHCLAEGTMLEHVFYKVLVRCKQCVAAQINCNDAEAFIAHVAKDCLVRFKQQQEKASEMRIKPPQIITSTNEEPHKTDTANAITRMRHSSVPFQMDAS